MYEEFRGKRVLVTGASGGLGAAIATAFGHHGARVLVHYRSREQGAKRTAESVRVRGGQALLFRSDLRSEDQIEALANFASGHWGGVDILVNNAGVVLKASVLDTGARHWDDLFQINLRAPFLLSRLIASRMIETGAGGCILHNSSIHATNSSEYFSAYAASKAGLEALSRVMALEWSPHNIRVNCVAPGVVPVERTARILEQTAADWMPHIPLGRFGSPNDIASLALYLCGDSASWITGQSFAADGGMLARINMPQRPFPEPPGDPEPVWGTSED